MALWRWVGFILGAVLGAVALRFQWVLLPDEECSVTDAMKVVDGGESAFLSVRNTTPPRAWDSDALTYNFGRYRRPFPDASLHPLNPFQRITQHKEWHWTAVSTGPWMVGVAFLQFQYVSHMVAYAFNSVTGEADKVQIEVMLIPTKYGPAFATSNGSPSSLVNGCTSMASHDASACYNPSTETLDLIVNVSLQESTLRTNLSLSLKGDTLSFAFPLGERRPAVVSKVAGAPTTGSFEVVKADGSVSRVTCGDPTPCLGAIDWTRSLARRLTLWNWASASWMDRETGDKLGIHVSSGVYEDSQGHGTENCIFVNGAMVVLDDKVSFTLNKNNLLGEKWTAASSDGSVAVTFTPWGRIHGEFHLYILDGDLHHVWGTWSGHLRVNGRHYTLDEVPGVMEEHYALW